MAVDGRVEMSSTSMEFTASTVNSRAVSQLIGLCVIDKIKTTVSRQGDERLNLNQDNTCINDSFNHNGRFTTLRDNAVPQDL